MAVVLRQAVESLPPHKTEVFAAVLEQLRWFAGVQIRNVAVSYLDWLVQKLFDSRTLDLFQDTSGYFGGVNLGSML